MRRERSTGHADTWNGIKPKSVYHIISARLCGQFGTTSVLYKNFGAAIILLKMSPCISSSTINMADDSTDEAETLLQLIRALSGWCIFAYCNGGIEQHKFRIRRTTLQSQRGYVMIMMNTLLGITEYSKDDILQ